jgi:hypothetical protein
MTRHFDIDRAIEEWLSDGPSQLPDRTIDGIVRQLDETKQRRPGWLPWRPEMKRTFLALGGVTAAIVVVLVAGAMFLGLGVNPLGFGGQPTPTATPSPTASPRPVPEEGGDLQPGTYVAAPVQGAGNPLTVTFTVPEGWKWIGGNGVYAERGGKNLGIQLEDITSLNGDPCDWSGTADDVSVGTTVEDLVEALGAQTAYEVSEPIDVAIGGYSGTRVDIIHPTEPFTGREASDAPGCDDGRYRIWSSAVHGPHPIYAQGPANRWQANILDVDGTRLVVVVGDFPDTAAEDRAEMDAIIDSIVIDQ